VGGGRPFRCASTSGAHCCCCTGPRRHCRVGGRADAPGADGGRALIEPERPSQRVATARMERARKCGLDRTCVLLRHLTWLGSDCWLRSHTIAAFVLRCTCQAEACMAPSPKGAGRASPSAGHRVSARPTCARSRSRPSSTRLAACAGCGAHGDRGAPGGVPRRRSGTSCDKRHASLALTRVPSAGGGGISRPGRCGRVSRSSEHCGGPSCRQHSADSSGVLGDRRRQAGRWTHGPRPQRPLLRLQHQHQQHP